MFLAAESSNHYRLSAVERSESDCLEASSRVKAFRRSAGAARP
jgi:hypothetical protein